MTASMVVLPRTIRSPFGAIFPDANPPYISAKTCGQNSACAGNDDCATRVCVGGIY